MAATPAKLLQDYKLRADFYHDILCFLRRLSTVCVKERQRITFFSVENGGDLPEFILTFTSSLSLQRIRDIIVEIPASHMMLETVALLSEYTGKRRPASFYEPYEPRMAVARYQRDERRPKK